MTLLNPLGLLALLAIPVVIAIHFLQRRAQKLPISTLFLLQKTQRESASGNKFDRLMNSIPLWLQLLMVLLLTWLLVQPRYVKSNSTQRIAIVLDSSASMSVFKSEIKSTLRKVLPELQGHAEQPEIWLLQSDASKSRLYHGKNIDEVLQAVDQWQPNTGTVDPSHSLRIARSLAGTEGALLHVTDIPRDSISYNAHLHAVGTYKTNCGFTGVSFHTKGEQLIWKTLVRNYSSEPVTRTWYLENERGQRTPEKSITIQPRKIITLQGNFPKGSNTAKLVLSHDEFLLDDILPMVRPVPKTLKLLTPADKELSGLAERMRSGFPNIVESNDIGQADFQLVDQSMLEQLTLDSILFVESKSNSKTYLNGNIVAEKHPLMDGLNWQSLLIREVPAIPHTETDEVLLWQGTRALILLRPLPNKKKCLLLNFNLKRSNAMKTEAVVVLLLRFIESIREQKLSHQQLITETSQPLQLVTPKVSKESPLTMEITPIEKAEGDEGYKKTTRTFTRSRNLYAPDFPCYFTVKHGDQALLTAANYFADTREADFSLCSERYTPASTNAAAVDRHTKEDHLWRYWIGLALLSALLSWHYVRKS